MIEAVASRGARRAGVMANIVGDRLQLDESTFIVAGEIAGSRHDAQVIVGERISNVIASAK